MQELNFRLDSYQDIFSDFDSREYKNRSLSQDFLDELRRVSKDKSKHEKIKIILSIPKERRNKNGEF